MSTTATPTVIPYSIRDPYNIDSRFRGNDRKGFTLVELLVVISIIAILSIIGITIFSGVQKSARDARRKGDLDAISKALKIYYYQQSPNTFPTGGRHSDAAQPWIPVLDTNYLVSVPTDPSSNDGNEISGYGYSYWGSDGTYATCPAAGQYFYLAARLENKSDSQNIGNTGAKFCDGASFESHWSVKDVYVINGYP